MLAPLENVKFPYFTIYITVTVKHAQQDMVHFLDISQKQSFKITAQHDV